MPIGAGGIPIIGPIGPAIGGIGPMGPGTIPGGPPSNAGPGGFAPGAGGLAFGGRAPAKKHKLSVIRLPTTRTAKPCMRRLRQQTHNLSIVKISAENSYGFTPDN
jgi:hypothetical protein